MEYARTYKDFSLDIIAIELSSFLENNSQRVRICSHHPVFSRKHLPYEVPIETEVYITGFPSNHSLHNTLPKEYHGKVVQKGEDTHMYGKYLFEINIDPPF